MNADSGARLLSSLWPQINIALSEENRADRLRFITGMLKLFQQNGVDVFQFVNRHEDIKSCAQHLGIQPSKPKPRNGKFVLDTGGLDDPVNYEFVGGPFDGAIIRIGTDLYETPPNTITLIAGEQPTTPDTETIYKLQYESCTDSNGNPAGDYLVYEHVK